jgi:hypothetical protein
MENHEVIEKIVRPIQEIDFPKVQSTYPQARVKGRIITTKIVGVSFEGRQEVVARLREGDRIWLEMEPTNPYDENAIKVCRSNGEQIGYLNRHLATSLINHFRAYGYPVRGRVALLTGSQWDGYTLGCVIAFKLPKPSQLTHNTQFDDWND